MKKNPTIKTWDDVDRALSEIGTCDIEIENLQGVMKAEIMPIKLKYEGKISEQEQKKKPLLEAIEVFFLDHESEVTGRSWEGAFGKCGLRLSPPALKPTGKMTWERVLSRILDLGYKNKYLRPLIHTVRDIDKETLLSEKVSDKIRTEIGVKISQDEKFWYEVKPKV